MARSKTSRLILVTQNYLLIYKELHVSVVDVIIGQSVL